MTSGGMPEPVSVTAIITYWPAVDLGMGGGVAVVEMAVGGLDGQLAAVGHGVARIDARD